MEDHARAVAALLDQVGAPGVHLIGHSMGGAVGLLLAELPGSAPLSHVSIEGNLVADDCRFGSRAIAAAPRDDFVDRGIDELRAAPGKSASAGEALYPTWVAQVDALALHRSASSLVLWSDSDKLLTRFRSAAQPKLYVFGARNHEADVLGRLPEIAKVAIEGAGHFVMNDQPRRFYRILANFIRR